MFKMNDKVVPKERWQDICCMVIRTRNETMCLVGNGRGGQKWIHESQLEHLCDVVHRYVMHKVMTDPEVAKKTILVVHSTSSKPEAKLE